MSFTIDGTEFECLSCDYKGNKSGLAKHLLACLKINRPEVIQSANHLWDTKRPAFQMIDNVIQPLNEDEDDSIVWFQRPRKKNNRPYDMAVCFGCMSVFVEKNWIRPIKNRTTTLECENDINSIIENHRINCRSTIQEANKNWFQFLSGIRIYKGLLGTFKPSRGGRPKKIIQLPVIEENKQEIKLIVSEPIQPVKSIESVESIGARLTIEIENKIRAEYQTKLTEQFELRMKAEKELMLKSSIVPIQKTKFENRIDSINPKVIKYLESVSEYVDDFFDGDSSEFENYINEYFPSEYSELRDLLQDERDRAKAYQHSVKEIQKELSDIQKSKRTMFEGIKKLKAQKEKLLTLIPSDVEIPEVLKSTPNEAYFQ